MAEVAKNSQSKRGGSKPGERRGGRSRGTPNKATTDARFAIATFVEGNVHRLTEWLDAVANGDPANEVKPNPAKAFELFQSIVEYHVPKLARQDVTLKGDANAPVQLVLSGSDIHG